MTFKLTKHVTVNLGNSLVLMHGYFIFHIYDLYDLPFSDILESYSRSPFLGTDTIFMDPSVLGEYQGKVFDILHYFFWNIKDITNISNLLVTRY